jgi:hypothetical protein
MIQRQTNAPLVEGNGEAPDARPSTGTVFDPQVRISEAPKTPLLGVPATRRALKGSETLESHDELARLIPMATARELEVVPLHQEMLDLTVCSTRPLSKATTSALIGLTGLSVHCSDGDQQTFERASEQRYRGRALNGATNHLRTTAPDDSAAPLLTRAHKYGMGGFFLVRREAVSLDVVKGKGFTILVEILAQHPHLRATKVAFHFGFRHEGINKGTGTRRAYIGGSVNPGHAAITVFILFTMGV